MYRFLNFSTEKNTFSSSYRSIISALGNNINRAEQSKIKEAFRILISISEKNTNNTHIQESIDKAKIAINELYLGYSSIISILLYDSYKLKLISKIELKDKFAPQIINILEDLVLLETIDTKNSQKQAENFIQLLLTSVSDVRAILIKLVDRVYKIRRLNEYAEPEKIKIAKECYYLYVQIAHRLGLYKLKNEIEDIAFSYIYPDEYASINELLKNTSSEYNEFISTFLEPIHKELLSQKIDYEITWRTKTAHSIWMKMKKQNVEFDQIFDIFAIRIILKSVLKDEKAACWQTYSIITNIYEPNAKRLRDWISLPKENAYESLHITVKSPSNKWVEIQIRTQRMNEQAEKGLAAHWKYKGGKTAQWFENWLVTIRELFEDPNSQLRDLTATNTSTIKPDEIFVFTPHGDLVKLKNGSTALDMAFSLHSDLGARCSGAKVNGKIVSLKHLLANGDQVSLLTSKKQKPKIDWLSFVKTNKAKNKIKRMLKEDEHLEAERGKEIIKRKFRNWKLPFNDSTINFLINHYKFNNALELYSKVANEELDALKLKELIKSQKEKEKKLSEPLIKPKSSKQIDDQDLKKSISIEGAIIKDLNFSYAKCCSPIPGDLISGFITIHKGISIHKQKCPNALHMHKNLAYRQVNVYWTKSQSELNFEVILKITGKDDMAMISKITDVVSKEFNIHINAFNVHTHKIKFEGILLLNVSDTSQLNSLLGRIKAIKGIEKAVRINSLD